MRLCMRTMLADGLLMYSFSTTLQAVASISDPTHRCIGLLSWAVRSTLLLHRLQRCVIVSSIQNYVISRYRCE